MNAHGIATLFVVTLLSLTAGCTDLEAEAQKLYKEAVKQERLSRIDSALATHRRVVMNYGETETAALSKEQIALLEQRIEDSNNRHRADMSSGSSRAYPTGAALMTLCANTFRRNLDLFRSDVGRYPTTSEGLVVLARDPGIDGYGGSSEATSYLEPGFLRRCRNGTSQVGGSGFAYESRDGEEYTLVIE